MPAFRMPVQFSLNRLKRLQARFAHAISQRDKKEIAALAKAKADLNIVSSFGSTPLMLGVRMLHV